MAKQDIRQIEFSCDLKGCEKKIKVEQKIVCGVKQPSPYPYGKKWVYLYAFNWKHARNSKVVRQIGKPSPLMKTLIASRTEIDGQITDHTDKHFCCREHLKKFVCERIDCD